MNDQELDNMLDLWPTPPVPPSVRENLRAGFAAKRSSAIASRPRPVRRFRLAAALVGVAAVLVLAVQAFPQASRLFSGESIPYTVDSEVVIYPMGRAPRAYLTMTSYNRNGKEVVLTWTMPDNPLAGAIHRTLNQLGSVFSGMAAPFLISQEELELSRSQATVTTGCESHTCLSLETVMLGSAADLLAKGCVLSGEVVGREVILGHPTVAMRRQENQRERSTFWLAPDLGCFALRVVAESQIDGVYRQFRGKQAVRISVDSDSR